MTRRVKSSLRRVHARAKTTCSLFQTRRTSCSLVREKIKQQQSMSPFTRLQWSLWPFSFNTYFSIRFRLIGSALPYSLLLAAQSSIT
ncbi:hypothetical protein FGO68_gene15372 [Halteria grandinella]|uniref:Uncharacterized protein n=1 Tax=Halteria grandinella TaxID=5974 RepID=A0A8J8NED2_HALGN|nr:hypothetical protein FGO68_gene15372 [Halteria grandinella]